MAAGLKVIKANARATTKAPAKADTSTPPSKRQRTSEPCSFIYKKSNKTAGIAKGDVCGKVNCTKHSRMKKQPQEAAPSTAAASTDSYAAALTRLPSFSLTSEIEVEQKEEDEVEHDEEEEEDEEEHQQKDFGLPIGSPIPSSEEDKRDDFEKEFDAHMLAFP